MKNKILVEIIERIIYIGAIYSMCSFIEYDTNPSEWSIFTRAAGIILLLWMYKK